MGQRKALLIGINYIGSKHSLAGCINDVKNVRNYLLQRGFPENNMVVLTDDQRDPVGVPTGKNMMAAFHWLVSNNQPGDSLFLHYSGHGGQQADPDGDRESGLDDTICPVDFERTGQLSSDTLHKALVTPLQRNVRLTILFDCCHSGSAVELPFVYRTDSNGNVNLLDSVKKGTQLLSAASNLLRGGFSMNKVGEAKQLIAGASSLFNSFQHRGEAQQEGLGEENFVEDWRNEGKDVFMFSGCMDDQTSADSSFANEAAGAMSWAFLTSLNRNPQQNYVQMLQSTRELLLNKYSQIPQLSCGMQVDLNQPVAF